MMINYVLKGLSLCMDINTIYIFVDSPKRYCFSKYNKAINLPKPNIRWEQITTETYELAQTELPQSSLLVNEIVNGIETVGFFIVDFADYSTLLKYQYQDWSEKWDIYTKLETKISEDEKDFKDQDLQNEYLKAGKIAQESLDKWVNLITFNIKQRY